MRLRTRHLALLLLLFSSLNPAESRALCAEGLSAGGRYVSMLLSQRAATAQTEPLAADPHSSRIAILALPAASLTQHRTAWTMASRSPARRAASGRHRARQLTSSRERPGLRRSTLTSSLRPQRA